MKSRLLISELSSFPVYMLYAVLCLVTQLCLTLCDPMDYSPPGSSLHGHSPSKNSGVGCHALLQGIFPTQGLNPGLPHCRWILYHLSHQGSPRRLEWVAYPFSRGSSQPRNQTRVSCIVGGWGRKDPPEEGMATHSGIFAWRIPWTEEPGRVTKTQT